MLCKNNNIVLRTIHDSIFLIDISDNYAGDKCALYEINDTGKLLWDNIDGNRTIIDLVEILMQSIIDDIPKNIIEDDVREYIEELEKKGFILEEGENG